MLNNNDCICAISTGSVESAIALIRLSGADALEIVNKAFRAKNAKRYENPEAYRLYFGDIYDGEEQIDEVLVSIFFAPHSYTGENMVEISCHGSLYIQQRILELMQKHGARIASPGEFTQRAFLNGKMELNQAEAVADLIASDSKASHQLAINQMKDGFSNEIKTMRGKLLNLVSLMELELDFSEEDVEFADRSQLLGLLGEVKVKIQSLLNGFKYGNVLKNGMPVVIAGKPNVGKSTLLNALLKEDRAIVSDIPGTTRDSLEDDMVIDGIRFRFIDTAGLRQTGDVIEEEGIRRAYARLEKAGLILLMTDINDSREDVLAMLNDVKERLENDSASLFVIQNKSDLGDLSDVSINDIHDIWTSAQLFRISAKHGNGMETLLEAMVESVRSMKGASDIILSNMRHVDALENALTATLRGEEAMEMGIPSDLISQDIREVLHHLGLITGEINTDEVLGNIFKNFCIGK